MRERFRRKKEILITEGILITVGVVHLAKINSWACSQVWIYNKARLQDAQEDTNLRAICQVFFYFYKKKKEKLFFNNFLFSINYMFFPYSLISRIYYYYYHLHFIYYFTPNLFAKKYFSCFFRIEEKIWEKILKMTNRMKKKREFDAINLNFSRAGEYFKRNLKTFSKSQDKNIRKWEGKKRKLFDKKSPRRRVVFQKNEKFLFFYKRAAPRIFVSQKKKLKEKIMGNFIIIYRYLKIYVSICLICRFFFKVCILKKKWL